MVSRILTIALITLFQFILFTAIGIAWILPDIENQVPFGYFANGNDIGGLSVNNAQDWLTETEGRDFIEKQIIITDGQKTWEFNVRDFGFLYNFEETMASIKFTGIVSNIQDVLELLRLQAKEKEIPMQIAWHQEQFNNFLDTISLEITQPPKNAYMDYQNGVITIIDEVPGETLDYDATIEKILHYVQSDNQQTLEVVKKPLLPDVTRHSFDGINAELTEFHSPLADHQNRTHNIMLAADEIDSKIISPGAVFSFNEETGPRTVESGYRMAPVVINDELEDEIGGGVCQLSTAIYNAALNVGLDIVEKFSHPVPVAYIEEGKDAAVAYGFMDFKFSNNLLHPIVVLSEVEDGNISVRIMGHAEDKAAALISQPTTPPLPLEQSTLETTSESKPSKVLEK